MSRTAAAYNAVQQSQGQGAYKRMLHGTTTVTYSVRVTATNAGGSNTKTRTNYITVTRNS